MTSQSKALRAAPALVALGAMFFFAIPQLRAQDDEGRHDCHERIEHAQAKLDQEVAEHGDDSLQARYAQHQLHEAREHCTNDQNGYYDNRSSDNGAYRDRRDRDQYDNRQYNNSNSNNNPDYNNPDYNNNPNYNNNDNGQYQPPPDDQRPR
jgi:hypothetical protein